MAALVVGADLGLGNSSLNTLGLSQGSAAQGQAGEGVYVNLGTGNLVLQQQDEMLFGLGLPVSSLRTYNSQGVVDGDNNDNWRIGFYRQLGGITGTPGAAGSSITRTAADGANERYVWDATRACYISTDGAGTYRTLSLQADGAWLWQDGRGASETYQSINGSALLLRSQQDGDGNLLRYEYAANGLLQKVTSASGETTELIYDSAPGREANLLCLRTGTLDAASGTLRLQTRVRYAYDDLNRLTQVTVDLSPQDNSIADGKVYTTCYSYEGSSHRLSSLTQSDAGSLSFAYDSAGRVISITDALGAVTRYGYEATCTTVTDAAGNVTRYGYDGKLQLTSIEAPAANGVTAVRRFQYNDNGDVTLVTDADGLATEFQYDGMGNQILRRDAQTEVRMQYNARNQLLSETRTPVGSTGPALTTRYVYDASGLHLRFAISAEGRVVQYRYNALGQRESSIAYSAAIWSGADAPDEAAMSAWVTALADPSQAVRTDYRYDFRGQLAASTVYSKLDSAGNGTADTAATTLYVYDAAGRLLQTVAPGAAQGAVTSQVYDGLGRILARTNALGQTTSFAYAEEGDGSIAGSAWRMVQTAADGSLSSSVFDRAGRLIARIASNSAGIGTTRYSYDANGRLRSTTDATGVSNWLFYDAAGRKSAELDGNGSLTEFRYDLANRLVQTIRYATAVTASIDSQSSLEQIRPLADSQHDQTSWFFYDTAGRLSKSVDAKGAVTENVYVAAGRVQSQTRYANAINTATLVAGAPAESIQVSADATHDRSTRYFYDNDGLLRGTLDPEGYLTEFLYDGAGRAWQSVAYATVAPNASASTLDASRPQASAADIRNTTLYDARGLVAGEIDGEGYLTEHAYDANGNRIRSTRYATALAVGVLATLNSTSSVVNLRPTATTSDQTSTATYDALNRVVNAGNAEGTITHYDYDVLGNPGASTTAWGSTEARTQTRRFDAQGLLLAELNGEGSAALAALGSAATSAQIEAVWNTYATRYTYDLAGRRIAATDANGNQTRYYYDADGQLRYTINALGEVEGRRYDALGQLVAQTRYATAIAPTALESLKGGLVDATLEGQILSSTQDSTRTWSYKRDGSVAASVDELGYATQYAYNSFGERIATTTLLDAGKSITNAIDYDRRGLQRRATSDVGGINALMSNQYDAFGRLISATDALGGTRRYSYDRLGRQVQSIDPLNVLLTTSYDAFSRVLTQTDGNGNITTTAYDDATRSVAITTPEGVSMRTLRNSHGETVQIVDGRGNTTGYTYDRNGNLTGTTNAEGIAVSASYDRTGRLIETIDGNGGTTTYIYNGVDRLLTRTVDPTGLCLKTTYGYDAKGQVVTVTDPNSVVTQTSYDLKGQVTLVAIDPAGLNLCTAYSYDARGKTLTITEGAGTPAARVTQYAYDGLGRRTEEVVNPGGLNLTTRYAYDKNGNLIKKTDALGNATRYVYDADNRLTYVIAPLGNVVETNYDEEGRVVRSVRYATPIALDALPDIPAANNIRIPAQTSSDQVTRTVYDKDGRAIYQIDALNYVTQTSYDGNGNVLQLTRYANPLVAPLLLTSSTVALETEAVASSNDRITRYVYDAANRLVYTISAVGSVTENGYDGNGNVIKTVAYAKLMSIAGNSTAAAIQAVTAANADNAQDRVTRHLVDKANRVIYKIDAMGYVQQQEYDGIGHLTRTIRYADPVDIISNATLASVTSLLPSTVPATAVVEQQTYDEAGRWIDTIHTVNGIDIITRRTYDAVGRIVEIVAACGTSDATRTHRVYDAAGRMTAETRAYGTALAATTRYTHDANGNVQTIVDPRGAELAEQDSPWALAQRKALGYADASGNGKTAASLTSAEQDALRALYATTQEFDATGHKTKVIDALGGVTATKYDAFGNAIQISDPRGSRGYFYFDGLNRNTMHVDPEGFVTQTRYTMDGKLASFTQYANRVVGNWSEATPPALLAFAATDPLPAGCVVVEPSKDQSTTFDYDRLGRLTKLTDGEGWYEAYTWDGLGNRTSMRNKAGGVTQYAYDVRGNLVAETLPVTSANAAGQQVAVINEYRYDARGNRIQTIEAAGLPEQRITTYDFDALDRQVRMTGEVLSIFDPITQSSRTVTPVEAQNFDARGNLTEKVDANGNRTLTYYDALDRKVAELDAAGTLTTYSYNDGKAPISSQIYGDCLAMPDTAGGPAPSPVNAGNMRETLFEYDRNERLVSTTIKSVNVGNYNAVSGQYQLGMADIVTRKVYDADGNVVQTIDGNGNATTHFYDKAGHKILEVDAQGYGIAWSYDLNGNSLRECRYASNYPALVSIDSDVATLLANWPCSSDDRITEFSYDRNGRLLMESRLNVAYSTVGAGSSGFAQSTGSAVTRYAYNGLGKVTRKTDANGDVSDTTYDVLGRQTREQGAVFTDFEGATVRPTTDFEYNGLQQVTRSVRRGKDDSIEADDQVTRYAYGTGGRLLSQSDPAATISFAYDAAGNVTRKSLPRANADGATVTDATYYRYDALNREIEHTDVGTGVSQQTRYNAYGEISAKGTNNGWQEFAEYDKAGRVFKSNSKDGVTKAYVYDAAGNATLAIESSGPDLKPMTLDQMLGLSNGSPDTDSLDAAGVHLTVSAFDSRNLLTDSFQPKMVTSHDGEAVQASPSSVQVVAGNFTGSTVAIGASNQATAVASSNPTAQGSVGITFGNIVQSAVWGVATGNQVQAWRLAADVTLALPNLDALGDGNIAVDVSVTRLYPGYISPPTQTSYFPPATSVVLPRLIFSYWEDIRLDITVFKQTPFGNVLLSSSSRVINGGQGKTDFSASTAIPKLVHFKGQPTPANRLVLWYKPAGSSGPFSQLSVPRYVINGNAVSGSFAFDWSSWPRGSYDIKYVALDASGNIVNQESGRMTLSDASASISQSAQAYGASQANSCFFEAGNVLNLTAQGTNASSVLVKYRTAGSNAAWTTAATLSAASIGGAATPGWFQWNYGSLSGDYEVIFESRTSTGATINKLYSSVRLNTTAPVFLAGITPYQNKPSTVTFSGNPPEAVNLKLSFRPKGGSGAYSVVTLSPTSSGSGTFYWDASALVWDDQTNYQYEFIYEAFNASGQLVNGGGGSIQLGATPSILTQYVSVSPPVLAFTPEQVTAARMALHYRVKGSAGDYIAVPELGKALDGKFYWDVTELKPNTGSTDYEYFYDLYDANGAALARTPGYITLGTTSSAQELKWVVTGLVSGDNAIHRSQRTNAFGEVVQEIDGLGRVTNFAYNTLGLLTQKLQPTTSATLENGYVKTLRPETDYIYDLSGHAIAQKDANGMLSSQVWLPGDFQKNRLLRQADGSLVLYGYDVFGNLRTAQDALGRVTRYYYDQNNRLVRIVRPQRDAGSPSALAAASEDRYEYDEAGNRIAHTNALGQRERTYYDSLGRVTSSVSFESRTTRYSYQYASGLIGLGGSPTGGIVKTTTDANGRTMVDSTDLFGHLLAHTDLGGHSFSYRYNNAGWLTSQTGSTGQNISYEYYANGMLRGIRDLAAHTLSTYEYDAEGNKTFEGYALLGTDNQSVRDFAQQASIQYDELNRVKTITDPRYSISYEYDAVGNRRHMLASYHDGVNGNVQSQDYWYAYDAVNRFTVSMGSLSGARASSESDKSVSIVRGTDGVQLAYDLAGQRRQATYQSSDGVAHSERYTYTADGYLEDTTIDNVLRARRKSDALGRVITYSEYNTGGALSSQRNSSYDGDSLVTRETTLGGGIIDYYRLADGTLSYTNSVESGTTTNTWYGYEWWDSARQSTITSQPYNENAPGWAAGTSHLLYDVNGHLKEARDEAGKTGFRYTTNAEGLILTRDEYMPNALRLQRYYYLDGKRVGDVGNGGPSRVDYVQALAQTGVSKTGARTFQPISSADFDQSYEPINAAYPGSTPVAYIVRAGDTLRSIAAQLWGDASMWYLIADANGLTGSESLTAGISLTIPNKVTNFHNSSETFRPYNPGEAIGDVTPNVPTAPPPPQQDDGCGIFGTIVVIAIAAVATVFTAGTMTAAAGSSLSAIMSAGTAALGSSIGVSLVAGAVGGAVSQMAGMALGIQDSFSWTGVAISSIGAGVGAGIGARGAGAAVAKAIGMSSQVAIAATSQFLGNTLTQGLATATGLQKKFDWRAVAAGTLGAVAGSVIGDALKSAGPTSAMIGSRLAGGLVRGAMAGSWAAVAGETFGNMLSNSIANSTQQTGSYTTAKSEESATSYWESHPMIYASNDVPDPLFPRDKVEVGFGGYGGNDPQLVPSAMSKFVSEYTAQHPNASMEEVQAAYDRAEAEQSDYYLSRRVVPASNGPLTITATSPQLLNVPEPEPGLMRGLAGNEQNRSVTDPRPSVTENFGLALNGALNGLVGMVKEPFAAAADGLRSSYQLGRGAMGLPMQQFRPYSAAGAAGATGMSYGEFAGRAIDGIAGSPARLIADGLNGNWKGFGAELLGTTGLAVGIGGLRAEAPRGVDYGAVWLDSLNIRQSQQSISYAKKGGYTLDDIACGYAENPSHPDLTIDVVRMRDGLLTSVDNSRPAVLNAMGGGKIRARIREFDDPLTTQEVRRFSELRNGIERVPDTWGEAVETRIWKQSEQFMSLYPNGSLLTPKITGAPVGSIWSQYNRYPWQR